MSATRTGTKLHDKQNMLGASGTLSSLSAFSVRYAGHLSIQVLIDTVGDGSGSAPSDTPSGVWELWCSADGVNFTQLTGSAVTTELAKIAPNGNNKVSAWAIFEGVPGTSIKLRYNRSSGGGTSSLVTVNVATW